MKAVVYTLIFFYGALSIANDKVKTVQNLAQSDSMVLAEKIEISNGVTASQSEEDSSIVLHKSSYKTSEGSFVINCTRTLKAGNYTDALCTVKMDSDLSSDIENIEFIVGAVGKVQVVRIYELESVNSLISILEPTGRYKSIEEVSVEVNGSEKILPKLQMSCFQVAHTDGGCSILLFPEAG